MIVTTGTEPTANRFTRYAPYSRTVRPCRSGQAPPVRHEPFARYHRTVGYSSYLRHHLYNRYLLYMRTIFDDYFL